MCDARFTGEDCSALSCPFAPASEPAPGGGVLSAVAQFYSSGQFEVCGACAGVGVAAATVGAAPVTVCAYGSSAPQIVSAVRLELLLEEDATGGGDARRRRRRLATAAGLQAELQRILWQNTPSMERTPHTLARPAVAVSLANATMPPWLWTAPICNVTLFGGDSFSGARPCTPARAPAPPLRPPHPRRSC